MSVNESQLKEIVAKLSGLDAAMIRPDTEFVRDLSMDSLKVIELIAVLSEEYGIQLSEDDAMDLHAFSDLLRFVEVS